MTIGSEVEEALRLLLELLMIGGGLYCPIRVPAELDVDCELLELWMRLLDPTLATAMVIPLLEAVLGLTMLCVDGVGLARYADGELVGVVDMYEELRLLDTCGAW